MQEQLKVFDEEIQKLKEQEKGEERNERIRELLRRREAAKSVGGITDGERTTAQSDTDDFLRKLEAQERASKEKQSDCVSEQAEARVKQYGYQARRRTVKKNKNLENEMNEVKQQRWTSKAQEEYLARRENECDKREKTLTEN